MELLDVRPRPLDLASDPPNYDVAVSKKLRGPFWESIQERSLYIRVRFGVSHLRKPPCDALTDFQSAGGFRLGHSC